MADLWRKPSGHAQAELGSHMQVQVGHEPVLDQVTIQSLPFWPLSHHLDFS